MWSVIESGIFASSSRGLLLSHQKVRFYFHQRMSLLPTHTIVFLFLLFPLLLPLRSQLDYSFLVFNPTTEVVTLPSRMKHAGRIFVAGIHQCRTRMSIRTF